MNVQFAGAFTVRVKGHAIVPPGPIAVPLYAVEASGPTVAEPEVFGVT